MLTLNRLTFTDHSTIGELVLDNQFQCYTLEPTCRKLDGIKRAIPAGKYEIGLYLSPAHKCVVPLLHEVPGHSYIEIHVGNFPKDTQDCILVGRVKGVDYLEESKLAFNKLMPKLEDKLKHGKLYIDIIGGVQKEAVWNG